MNPGAADRARSRVEAVWERRRPAVLGRADSLTAAVDALDAGGHDEELRAQAEQEAHRLAGTLASFGLPEAARIARALERELAAHRPAPSGSAPPASAPSGSAPPASAPRAPTRRATQLAGDLRDHLHRPHPAAAAPTGRAAPADPFLLLVTTNTGAARDTAEVAAARGLGTETVADLHAAEALLAEAAPEAVLLGPVGDWADMVAFVERLSRRTPAVPVLFMTSATAYTARLEAVRAGARAVVSPSVSPSEVVELVESILARERRDSASLLVVDDDPAFLALVESLLSAEGLGVTTLDDARQFWQILEDTRPDLVLLDLTMPHTTGTELCRVLRADPRWAGLPVIVLTSHPESVAAQEAFAVGADDYVVKTMVGPELMTRITNRLERVRLYRQMADRDPLTGLVNRRKFSEEVSRLLRLADRNRQNLSFVMVDLDRFKEVNDRYGHALGDEVLHRLAQVLTEMLREEDVVGRWGGEEFVLALYGMSGADSVQRATEVLERFRQETFVSAAGERFHCTFSAGVAQSPDDGTDIHLLYQAADQALFRAKAAGRGRVLPAGWPVEVTVVPAAERSPAG